MLFFGKHPFLQKKITASLISSNNSFTAWLSNHDSLLTVVVLFSLVAVLIPFGNVPLARAATQISYNCGDPSADVHCYGQVTWGGANGADTRITLHRMNGGNGFVTTEMWLGTSDTAYWVEAGIASDASFRVSDATAFFWADNRPNGGGYHNHYSSFLSSSDWSQPNALVRITRSGSSSWNLSVTDNVTSLTGTSTNNNITIGIINIGTELAGTSGASEPTNHFIDNRWLNSSGNFQYQTVNGSRKDNSPLSSNWTTPPSSSSTGGNFYTCIAGSGC
jgi:hypothetical protein